MTSGETNRLNSHWLQACVLLCAMLVLPAGIASAQDAVTKASGTKKVHVEDNDYWNQFRGPNGDGKSVAKNLPVEFSETKNVRWKTPIHDNGWSSPVVWGNQIWLTTGRELWKERLRAGGDHWASPLYADAKIYFSGKKGIVSVIAAARGFQLLAENRFEASFIASPAIAGDAIILRSLTHLYCVAEGYERTEVACDQRARRAYAK